MPDASGLQVISATPSSRASAKCSRSMVRISRLYCGWNETRIGGVEEVAAGLQVAID